MFQTSSSSCSYSSSYSSVQTIINLLSVGQPREAARPPIRLSSTEYRRCNFSKGREGFSKVSFGCYGWHCKSSKEIRRYEAKSIERRIKEERINVDGGNLVGKWPISGTRAKEERWGKFVGSFFLDPFGENGGGCVKLAEYKNKFSSTMRKEAESNCRASVYRAS